MHTHMHIYVQTQLYIPRTVHEPSSEENQCDEEEQSSPSDDKLFTIREYRKQFVEQNPKFGLTIIRNSHPTMRYVRPRSHLPPTGKPIIFFCEGVQADGGKLVGPGRAFPLRGTTNENTWRFVAIGCIWVSYLLTTFTHLFTHSVMCLYLTQITCPFTDRRPLVCYRLPPEILPAETAFRSSLSRT